MRISTGHTSALVLPLNVARTAIRVPLVTCPTTGAWALRVGRFVVVCIMHACVFVRYSACMRAHGSGLCRMGVCVRTAHVA